MANSLPIVSEEVSNLSDIFDKDPLDITPEERARVILTLREARKSFNLKETKAKKEGKRIGSNAGITLEALGLIPAEPKQKDLPSSEESSE